MAPDRALEAGWEDFRSRRQLLIGGGAAALGMGAVISGCGRSAPTADTIPIDEHSPGARGDVRILNKLLDLEYRAIYAYTASVPLLAAAGRRARGSHKRSASPPKAKPAKRKPPAPLSTVPLLASNAASTFLGQALGHTHELKGIIKQAGGKPGRPAPSYDLPNHDPANKREVLLVLHEIEQGQLVAYLDAVTLLTPGELRGAAAAIFANHAQHVMVLRMELGLPPIPSAFVTGNE